MCEKNNIHKSMKTGAKIRINQGLILKSPHSEEKKQIWYSRLARKAGMETHLEGKMGLPIGAWLVTTGRPALPTRRVYSHQVAERDISQLKSYPLGAVVSPYTTFSVYKSHLKD